MPATSMRRHGRVYRFSRQAGAQARVRTDKVREIASVTSDLTSWRRELVPAEVNQCILEHISKNGARSPTRGQEEDSAAPSGGRSHVLA